MFKNRYVHWSLFVPLVFLIVGCGFAPSMQFSPSVKDFLFSPNIGETLYVQTGDTILVSGKANSFDTLVMSKGISSIMPGSGLIPFSFAIDKTSLIKRYSRGKYNYFCAPSTARSASFPGLGSVVFIGDCVGVRVHSVLGRMDWVVDNSRYNGFTQVWHRSVSKNDDMIFDKGEKRERGEDSFLNMIVFDGYYSNLLHFTFINQDGLYENEKEFKFDYLNEGPLVVGIRGNFFEVLNITNSEMSYRWKGIKD